MSDFVTSLAFEGPIVTFIQSEARHAEPASKLWDSDRDSDGSAGGGESGLLLAFLDFVECCFKKRARAGRGTGAGRLCCFTFTSDCTSGLRWWSTEEFWDTAGAATTLLTSEQFVLTMSLQSKEFKKSLSSLTFFFVRTVSFFSGDVSVCVLTDILSLFETSRLLLFKVVV